MPTQKVAKKPVKKASTKPKAVKKTAAKPKAMPKRPIQKDIAYTLTFWTPHSFGPVKTSIMKAKDERDLRLKICAKYNDATYSAIVIEQDGEFISEMQYYNEWGWFWREGFMKQTIYNNGELGEYC